jgi:hypothetical protein
MLHSFVHSWYRSNQQIAYNRKFCFLFIHLSTSCYKYEHLLKLQHKLNKRQYSPINGVFVSSSNSMKNFSNQKNYMKFVLIIKLNVLQGIFFRLGRTLLNFQHVSEIHLFPHNSRRIPIP